MIDLFVLNKTSEKIYIETLEGCLTENRQCLRVSHTTLLPNEKTFTCYRNTI